MTTRNLPAVQSLLKDYIDNFPDKFWSTIYQHKLKEGRLLEDTEYTIYADFFQFQHEPDHESKKTVITQFCTIPKDRACWDVIMAMYVVLEYVNRGAIITPANVAKVLLRNLMAAQEYKSTHWSNILNFGETEELMTHLLEVASGKKENLFFTDPEKTIERILDLLIEFSTGENGKEFKEKSMENVSKVINDEKLKLAFQKDLQILNGY